MTRFESAEFEQRQYAPATERNRDPILGILKRVLRRDGIILEIASGTGEHAVYFAPRFHPSIWQPSDPNPELRASIRAWAVGASLENLRPPLDLDVRDAHWPVETEAAGEQTVTSIVCTNMIHIAPWEACIGLMAGAGRILPPGGILYLYGPYKMHGAHTSPSNEVFDRQLRAQDPEWGVRDISQVEEAANAAGLALVETIPMPANNFSLIFRKI